MGAMQAHEAASLMPVQGTCKEEFAAVRETFADNLNTGRDLGASVAVFVDGECVVDLWGGYFDATLVRPIERDTITQMFSSTKTITALCALVLADRGELDLDAPVASYWPEFAAAGKNDIKVRQLLNHSSGMAGWAERMTLPILCDVERSTAMLARQAPLWTPGTAHGYHAFTQGHLVGEVIRRVTGQSLGTFLREEITDRLVSATTCTSAPARSTTPGYRSSRRRGRRRRPSAARASTTRRCSTRAPRRRTPGR